MKCPIIIKEVLINGRVKTAFKSKILSGAIMVGGGIQARQLLPGWGPKHGKRRIRGTSIMVDKNIPLMKNLPEDNPAVFMAKIRDKLIKMRNANIRPHIVFTVKELGDKTMEDIGFKVDRKSIPMPKHILFGKAWRHGRLHAHRYGPVFIVHRDDIEPKNIKDIIKHNLIDTPKDVYTRWIKKIESPVGFYQRK